jgi:hypothetical protein
MSFVYFTIKGHRREENGEVHYHADGSGITREGPDMLSCAIRQCPELLPCNIIQFNYHNIGGDTNYGTYQED